MQELAVGVFGEQWVEELRDDVSLHFAYGLNAQDVIQTTSEDATIAESGSVVTLTGNAGTATLTSFRKLRYRPGHSIYFGGTADFSGTGTTRFGLFDSQDGIFFEVTNGELSVVRRSAGVDTAVAQADFNGEDWSDVDLTKLNIYRITYAFYGVAAISFQILLPYSKKYVTVHTMYTHGVLDVPHHSIPLLPVALEAEAGGVIRTASFRAGVLGGSLEVGFRRFGHDGAKLVGNTDTETAVVAYKSVDTFNSVSNKILAQLTYASFATDLEGILTIRFKSNVTYTGDPTWTDISTGNSTVQYATDAVYASGGQTQLVIHTAAGTTTGSTANVASGNFDLTALGLSGQAGQTWTITAERETGTTAYTVHYAFNWKELF